MADKDPGYSPFVQAVAGEGTSPPDVRVMAGWLGASGEEGHVRLYLDATLSAYVDIPRDAVLYSEEIPNSHPAGKRSVWVKSDAELKEGGTAIARAAKFLFGQVQQDFLGGGGGAGGAQPQAPQTQICLTYKPGCEPSVANPCITRTEMPNCRFTRIPCSAIDACPSALIQCDQPTSPPCITASPFTCPGPVTVKWPDCGSAVDACPTRICIPQTETGPQCFGGVAQEQAAASGFFCVPRTQTLQCRPRTMSPCPTMLGCGLQQPQINQRFAPDPGPPLPLPSSITGCPPPPLVTVTEKPLLCCYTEIGEICNPKPSVDRQCQTENPVLCPNPNPQFVPYRGAVGHTAPGWCGGGGGQYTGHPCVTGGPCTGFAANVGWTAPNACPYHSYPMCNSHIPCATAPPCF